MSQETSWERNASILLEMLMTNFEGNSNRHLHLVLYCIISLKTGVMFIPILQMQKAKFQKHQVPFLSL